jgi:Lrp/AsnC family leucine-responsive transcriptional regulator
MRVRPIRLSLTGRGKSTSACWRRVRVLEESGTTKKIVEQFAARVRNRPEVLECFATTGNADDHLRVVVGDIVAYSHDLDSFVFKLPGIRFVRTNVVPGEMKSTAALPFAQTTPNDGAARLCAGRRQHAGGWAQLQSSRGGHGRIKLQPRLFQWAISDREWQRGRGRRRPRSC